MSEGFSPNDMRRARQSLTRLLAPNSVRNRIMAFLAGEGPLMPQDMYWVTKMSIFKLDRKIKKMRRRKRDEARRFRKRQRDRRKPDIAAAKKKERYAKRVPPLPEQA